MQANNTSITTKENKKLKDSKVFTTEEELMHDFRKTRIIIWVIAKFKANIIYSSSKMWMSEDNSNVAEEKRGELTFNDCKCYYSDFT